MFATQKNYIMEICHNACFDVGKDKIFPEDRTETIEAKLGEYQVPTNSCYRISYFKVFH